jgi:hypothetical protein
VRFWELEYVPELQEPEEQLPFPLGFVYVGALRLLSGSVDDDPDPCVVDVVLVHGLVQPFQKDESCVDV